jgi:hypothetical protein
MVAARTLVESIDESHRSLVASLDDAAAMQKVPGQPRKGFERADLFLAAASRHLNTVESVLFPVAQRRLDADLVNACVGATKDLEVALVNAKGREYGSAYAVNMPWPEVWAEVRSRLEHERDVEHELVERLAAELDDDEQAALVEHLERAEPDAPSRPHPHAPHLGVPGRVARRVLHTVDSFWDTAESRMLPEKEHPERKKPGRMGQYLLADPRFDQEE